MIATTKTELLTHSRQDCFKVCRRKHWYAYELGIRPATDAKALRMGSAYHDALECLANTNSLDAACEAIYGRYESMPENFDELGWLYERETVLRLVCGYHWRWESQPLEHIAAEMKFELPLLNPETGKPTSSFKLAGKIDGIVKVDGRLGVLEHKLLSEELDADSSLWRRMQIDHQISLYVLAARRLGYPVDCVFYSVTRKPTIGQTAVPVLDELGAKIVLNQFGDRVKTDRGLWRQTGDKERGYVLQTRAMTPEEWGEKLSSDIAERPEFYFVRKEISRLDQDLSEYESELWEIQRTMRDAQRHERHYRTCNKETCAWCPFFSICTTGQDPTGSLPEGFVRLTNPHPELGVL